MTLDLTWPPYHFPLSLCRFQSLACDVVHDDFLPLSVVFLLCICPFPILIRVSSVNLQLDCYLTPFLLSLPSCVSSSTPSVTSFSNHTFALPSARFSLLSPDTYLTVRSCFLSAQQHLAALEEHVWTCFPSSFSNCSFSSSSCSSSCSSSIAAPSHITSLIRSLKRDIESTGQRLLQAHVKRGLDGKRIRTTQRWEG